MSSNDKLWSYTYKHMGKTYSIRIHGSEEEADTHANNLVLNMESKGQVVAVVDYGPELYIQKELH